MEITNTLTVGVDKWNEWRSFNQDEEVALKDEAIFDNYLGCLNLNKVYISNIQLINVYLAESNFGEAILNNVNLSKSILRKVNFQRVKGNKVILDEADLRGANLDNCELIKSSLKNIIFNATYFDACSAKKSNFANSDFSGGNIRGIDFYSSDFQNSKLKGIDASPIKVREVNNKFKKIITSFKKSNLKSVDLSSANLQCADFTKADLSMANLNNTDLSNAIFIGANLESANLSGSNLKNANFNNANLNNINLENCNLEGATFQNAILSGVVLKKLYINNADLRGSNLSKTVLQDEDFRSINNLIGVDFSNANLSGANFSGVNLSQSKFYNSNLNKAILVDSILCNANLKNSDLTAAIMINTDLSNANLDGCRIFGVSAWGVKVSEDTKQSNLIITPEGDADITVDNLEVAQFIYLLLNNKKIRSVIGTIADKAVLIIGRFTKKRKKALNSIKDELRRLNYVPILFDFEKPNSSSFIETISILGHLSRFVIADLTDAKVVLQELPVIVKETSVPVIPIMLSSKTKPPVTLYDLRINHRSLLDIYRYENLQDLLINFQTHIIYPVEEKLIEMGMFRQDFQKYL